MPSDNFATPVEMLPAASTTTSNRANFVTGVPLPIDGGWNAYGAAGDVVKIRHD